MFRLPEPGWQRRALLGLGPGPVEGHPPVQQTTGKPLSGRLQATPAI